MSKETTSLVFTGDIGFDKYMQGRWNDPQLIGESLLDFFRSADHVIANVEGALTDAQDNGSHGVFFHSMDPEAIRVLEDIHADIWNISNNHIMDAGEEGLVNTCRLASQHGAQTIGAGLNDTAASEPVYLDEAGGIGMFGVAYMAECIPATETEPGVFRWDDMDKIAERIREVKRRCRWCIVVAHGGEEFAAMPNPYTRERYLKFLEMGADVVVAHHPHVVENFETFGESAAREDGAGRSCEKAIFYSLGNFIFDTDYQRAHPYTEKGVLLKLTFTEDEMTFEAVGTDIIRTDETIREGALPDIFTDISAEDYELLAPLASAAFIAEERKKMIYLEPEKFADAPEEVWDAYFYSEEPDGYAKGAHMDLSIVVPFAKTAEGGEWQKSGLSKVKAYLQTML